MVQALREIIELEHYDEASLIEAFSSFECVNPTDKVAKDVMQFLVQDAIEMEKIGATRTYLILNDEAWKQSHVQIDGYFSIALKVLYFDKNISKEWLNEVFKDDDRKNCPAYLIGQLARSNRAKSGEGSRFLDIALAYISQASDIAGGRLVYLDCSKDKRTYYEKRGFTYLQDKHNSDLIQMYRVI